MRQLAIFVHLSIATLGCGILMGAAGCESSPGATAEAPARAEAEPAPSAAASEDAGGAPDCVERCVMDNQMRAEPAEAIRAECEEQCLP